MKPFKGKAIYQPTGKAAEYSEWACNFYTGCSTQCDYCYCKRGVMSAVWSSTPQLKKCFNNESEALSRFNGEMLKNKSELQKNGLFFSFTTDPLLFETRALTTCALFLCAEHQIPAYVLTKQIEFIKYQNAWNFDKTLVYFGFTLTGMDEQERNAPSTNARLLAMEILQKRGFKSFASIEPVIDLQKALAAIKAAQPYCNLFKIGLLSGKKFDKNKLLDFMYSVHQLTEYKTPIYWKDSVINQLGISRANLPANCVNSDYKLHNQ